MNHLPSHSDIACVHSDCVQSRSLRAFIVEIICLCSCIKLCQKLSFRIDPNLTDENDTGSFIDCK